MYMFELMTAYNYGGSTFFNEKLTRRPVMTAALVLCALVFLVIRTGKGSAGRLKKAVSCGCYDRERILRGQWWRLLTVGFTHIEAWHLLVNLYSLYALSALEELYGHLWFAVILFGSVTGGSLLELAVSKNRYSVGLSGGLYGLMFSYALISFTYGSGDLRSLVLTIIINLAINFAPGIAWQAHIGGALTGLLFTEVMLHLA